jgi:predicted amidohydrolase
MSLSSFKLAMGQMLVEGGNVAANLERAKNMINAAAAAGCSIIVLPECLDIGWAHPKAQELAEPIPGKYSSELCSAACSNKIYVAAGLTERYGDRLYNSALFISPEGNILVKHRKINILTDVEGIYSVGTSLSAVETPLGVIGINICADNSPNSLIFGHSLARMGAQLLLSPSAWAVDSDHNNINDPYGAMWEEAYTSLSCLYDMTVVGVSNVGWVAGGPWKGKKCIGCSLAIGPKGIPLAKGSYGHTAEELIIIDVEMQKSDIRGTEFRSMLSKKGYTGP